MHFDDLKQKSLFDFWDQVRGDRLVPPATEIDPSTIASLLKEIAIFEIFGEADARYRLAGTELTERLGSDPTGKNVIDFATPETKIFIAELFQKILRQPAGAIVHYENTYNTGKKAPVRSLFLPLGASETKHPRIVSIHTIEPPTSYEDEQATTTIGTIVQETIWIDIGAGIPQSDQVDG